MAISASSVSDDVEFLMLEDAKHFGLTCDIDLTCYETFYDSPESSQSNSKVENDVKGLCDPGCLEVFERNEELLVGLANISEWPRVGQPNVDSKWLNRDGSVHDVLSLYNAVRSDLFGDLNPTSLTYGVDSSLAVPSLLGSEQVPTLDDSSGNIVDKGEVSNNVQPRLSLSAPNESELKAEIADARPVIVSPSSVHSTESDSEDADARVPSSCRSDFLPTGWYHIEE